VKIRKTTIKERRATYFGGAFIMLLLLLGRSITNFHDWHTLLLTITALVSLYLFDIEDKRMYQNPKREDDQ